MTLSSDQVQHAVAVWRLQEYFYISFFALYVYYALTTIDEEVITILPQRWNSGKTLFMVIRYGTLIYISLQLSRDYRHYYPISLQGCKVLWIMSQVAAHAAWIACDICLGLCLGALLQLRTVYTIPVTVLSAGPSGIAALFSLVSDIQYPAGRPPVLPEALGYPCYTPYSEAWSQSAGSGARRNILRYITCATTALLLISAAVTLVVRYKGHSGRLIRVLRRDGGLYYVTLAANRFGSALVDTPAIIPVDQANNHAASKLLFMSNMILMPIFAQRLLLNMRQVEYIGSCPVISSLLFAPPPSPSIEELSAPETQDERLPS